jgi:hypothetical protein
LSQYQQPGRLEYVINSQRIRLLPSSATNSDAAQERGEIRSHGERATVSEAETLGFKDAGLNAKDIHEARLFRDAEQNDPGVVE